VADTNPDPGQALDDHTTLAQLRDLMRQFVTQRAWDKFHQPKNLAASVSIEAAELLELFQWLTPEETARRCKEDPAFRQAVQEEMADVLMYLVSMANVMDIDIARAVADKMQRNVAKYPADKYYGWYERPQSPPSV